MPTPMNELPPDILLQPNPFEYPMPAVQKSDFMPYYHKLRRYRNRLLADMHCESQLINGDKQQLIKIGRRVAGLSGADYRPEFFWLGLVLGHMAANRAINRDAADFRYKPESVEHILSHRDYIRSTDISADRSAVISGLSNDQLSDWLYDTAVENLRYTDRLTSFLNRFSKVWEYSVVQNGGIVSGGIFSYGVTVFEHARNKHEAEQAWKNHPQDAHAPLPQQPASSPATQDRL